MLVAGLALAVVVFLAARGVPSPSMAKLGFQALLYAAVPGWVVMRVSAQWLADRQAWPIAMRRRGSGLGYMTSEAGLLFLIAATVVAGRASKKAQRGETPTTLMQRLPMGFSLFLVTAYVVTIWAMTTKPV